MKKFEQPVVALNEMMMSESIASICCYSKTTIGNVWGTSSSVITALNGGSISTGADGTKRYFVGDSILMAFGGTIPLPQVHYKLYFVADDIYSLQNNEKQGALGSTVGGLALTHVSKDAVRFTYGSNGVIDTYSYVTGKANGDITTYDKAPAVPTGATYNYLIPYAQPSTGRLCDHSTDSCPWVVDETIGAGTAGQHTGATTAHGFGGQKWWNSHVAQQYAS